MIGKYRKWLRKHDVQYYQKTRKIWKHSENKGGTARYSQLKKVCVR